MQSGGHKKVAIFIPSLRGGGAERAMLIFGQELLNRGFEVDLILLHQKGPLGAFVPPGMRIENLDQPRMIRALPRLVSYLRRERPIALYSTIVHANVVALLAARVARVATRVVVRESNVPVTEPKQSLSRKVTFRLVPLVYPWAAGIISVSEGVAEELRSISPRIGPLVRVIPTPVIYPELFERAEEAVDHPFFADSTGTPVVLGCARLQPHKGFVSLVRAFAKLRAVRPLRLIILGEGKDRDRILAEAVKLGVASDVSLPGFVLNPFPFMKKASAFVLSSEYEGMPNVLIQAMALATPVVATDCRSGPREILAGGVYGTLVPVGDVEALEAGIASALQSPRRPDASERVQAMFGVARATDAYLDIAGIVSRTPVTSAEAAAAAS